MLPLASAAFFIKRIPMPTELQFAIETTEALKDWVEQKAAEWDCTEAQIIEVLLVAAIWAVDEGTFIIDRPEKWLS